MRVVILAGGLGTRLAEETTVIPKPMVEIGGRPIVWHIMKHYAHFGFKEFFLALGYKSSEFKRYFLEEINFDGSLTLSMKNRSVENRQAHAEDWIVHLMETGLYTITGGRLKRLSNFLNGGTFMMTYGDGVSDIDLSALLRFHQAHGKLATVTAVRPPARFGGIEFDGDRVVRFSEKPQTGEGWINGGFFVLEPAALDYISGDDTVWEREPLERLATDGQLMAFRHEGFWQPMDTVRERKVLEELWHSGSAPWKVW